MILVFYKYQFQFFLSKRNTNNINLILNFFYDLKHLKNESREIEE